MKDKGKQIICEYDNYYHTEDIEQIFKKHEEENKQFEEMEMAREIHKALLNCHNNYNCHKCEFRHDTSMSFCKAEYIAKSISEHYQPKHTEDSVVNTPTIQCETYSNGDMIVISMEEYNGLKYAKIAKDRLDKSVKYYQELIEDGKLVASVEVKETAQKVIRKVREMLNNCETIYEDDEYLITPYVGYLMKDVDNGLDEIEKEFNDEE